MLSALQGNLYESLPIHIPIEELKVIEKSYYHAAKVVEFDGISLVVRSLTSIVPPSESSLKGIVLAIDNIY